jgi:hypothetical protein
MKTHTKDELLNSPRRKGESTMGPGHDGAPKPGHYAKGEPGLLTHPHSTPNSAGATDHTNVKVTLGKQPLPKRVFSESGPPIHGGMAVQTKSGTAYGGDHRSAVDALTGLSVVRDKSGKVAAAHPLSTPPVAKNLRPVEHSFGQRSRTLDAATPEGVGVAAKRGATYREAYKTLSDDLSARLMNEALSVAGPDHPINQSNRGRK